MFGCWIFDCLLCYLIVVALCALMLIACAQVEHRLDIIVDVLLPMLIVNLVMLLAQHLFALAPLI